jgi:hypothetical protein
MAAVRKSVGLNGIELKGRQGEHMKIWLRISVITIGLYLTLTSMTYNMTVQNLVKTCEKTEGVEYGMCLGFIHGVDESMRFMLWALNEERGEAPDDKPYCIPDHISPSQMRTVVLTYVKRFPSPLDPELAAKPAAPVVLSALEQEFPCKN